jgi:hypothetical protein
MITEENLSKTGLMARVASRQVKCKTGFGIVSKSFSNGSSINMNPFW